MGDIHARPCAAMAGETSADTDKAGRIERIGEAGGVDEAGEAGGTTPDAASAGCFASDHRDAGTDTS
jgi:hypothetical protein